VSASPSIHLQIEIPHKAMTEQILALLLQPSLNAAVANTPARRNTAGDPLVFLPAPWKSTLKDKKSNTGLLYSDASSLRLKLGAWKAARWPRDVQSGPALDSIRSLLLWQMSFPSVNAAIASIATLAMRIDSETQQQRHRCPS
jgi:hypothetical protein